MNQSPGQPRFRVDGVDVPPSVQNIMSELGPEVVIPVGDVDPPSHRHGRQVRVDGVDVPPSVQNVMSELGPEVVIPVGDVPPSHRHGQQVQGVVPVTHFHPAQVHGVAGGSGARQLSRPSAPGVPPGRQFHQVPLHLRPGQLQVQGGAGGSATRQLSRASDHVPLHLRPGHLQGVAVRSGPMRSPAPGVLPANRFHPVPLHLRPGHLQGVAVRSGPMRSPAPVVRRPPVPHQPDQMLRTVHVSPIPLGFRDTLQFKLQIEQIFGIGTVEECKLPIQHKGYGFVTFYTNETFDCAISRRTINLNLRQGTEADALSLKPALRR